MNTKSINKNIASKINEWIDSIEDESIRKGLRDPEKGVLVSGGCIASLLLGVGVNDYDIYIKSVDVLRSVVQYYTKGRPIEVLDFAHSNEYKQYLEDRSVWMCKYPDSEEDYAEYSIAIRNLKPDQIKLYMSHHPGGLKIEYPEDTDLKPYRPVFFSPNAISLSDDVQIVVRFWGDAEQIHKSFDFIHATNYWDFKTGLTCNTDALLSLMTKTLKYHGSLYPVTSIMRMKKFVKRGFNIGAGEIMKIIMQINELDLTNPDVLEEQLTGVDVAYFSTLINALRDIEDKSKITSGYVNEIIERVFSEHVDQTEE
jgi:hypothetical protein